MMENKSVTAVAFQSYLNSAAQAIHCQGKWAVGKGGDHSVKQA